MLRIGKNEIKHSFEEYTKEENWDTIDEKDIAMYLASPIKIDEGVSFGRIFELCILHKDLFNVIFYAQLRGFKIEMWEEEFNLDPDEKDGDITYLEVYRILNIWGGKISGEIWFDNYLSFHGIAENYVSKHSDGKEPYDQSFAVEFTPLNNLKEIEIRANEMFQITDSSGDKVGSEDVIVDEKEPLTLFDFLGTILYEISFSGAPEQRDKKIDELNKRIENIDYEDTYELIEEDGVHYFVDKDGNKEEAFNIDDGDDESEDK